MATETITTDCAIAGGGPAGVMLGFLLARAGVDVVVLEKHEDFFRDFRGDTIHPSTLELMYELGLIDEFLKRPHQEVRQLGAQIGDDLVQIADFSHLPTHCKFLAFMPQWHFLNFLAEAGKRYPTFHLRMQAEVDELLKDGDRVVGLKAATPQGDLEVRADLVVGTDGRHSTVRKLAGFEVEDRGAPMDVLWLRLSRQPERRSRQPRPHRAGPLLHHDRPRRLLAVRLRHSQRAASTSCAAKGSRPSAWQLSR